jgi:glycosyltransferase involved in cell wall biosynthesis
MIRHIATPLSPITLALRLAGRSAKRRRKWTTAAGYYGLALLLQRDSSHAVQLAHSLKESGRLWQAEAAYRFALSLKHEAETYLHLGALLKRQGRRPDASEALLSALMLDPQSRDAERELKVLGYSQQEINEGRWSGSLPHRFPVRSSLSPRLRPTVTAEDGVELLRSGLFNEGWYSDQYGIPADRALSDYLQRGAFQGRNPNFLFDSAWYLLSYPDVARTGVNPLLHYLKIGAAEGCDPHPAFKSLWYLDQYPEVRTSGINPLAHYLTRGASEGGNPNEYFDSNWYRARVPELSTTGEDPFLHYQRVGYLEEIPPNPSFNLTYPLAENSLGLKQSPVEYLMRRRRAVSGTADVTSIEIRHLKTGASFVEKEVCLFVALAAQGRIQPHVLRYLGSLQKSGMVVILIAIVDSFSQDLDALCIPEADHVLVRQNHGWDFAAWSHALKELPSIWGARLLLFANDSVFGPVHAGAFQDVLERLRGSPADVVALTESSERQWHVQSYFFALKGQALARAEVYRFWDEVQSVREKQEVIDRYETGFSRAVKSAGLSTQILFPVQPNAEQRPNPTLFHWRELLKRGFPFVKVMLLRDGVVGVDTADWQQFVAAYCDDAQLIVEIEQYLRPRPGGAERVHAHRHGPVKVRALQSHGAPRIAFIGPWNFASGLGTASRGYVTALRHLRSPLNLHSIKPPFHIHRRTAPAIDVLDFDAPADVCILHLNPDAWPDLLTDVQRRIYEQSRYRVGLWVWEMETIPVGWQSAIDEADAIWVPSTYCADALGKVRAAGVSVVPHVVPVVLQGSWNSGSRQLRKEIGIGERRVILYSFDGASYLARKNPFALVRAFEASRLAEDNWCVVLKTKNLHDVPAAGTALERAAASSPSVLLVNEEYTRDRARALLDLCDIYCSPHCAEGFGITIAEAMAAGKVVVATDYGGSKDFLDSSCGFPVGGTVLTLDTHHGHYNAGNRWMDVDEEALAAALVSAASEASVPRLHLAQAARERIRRICSPDAVASRMGDLLRRDEPAASASERQSAC